MGKKRKDKPTMQIQEADRISRVVAERERRGVSTATRERIAKVGADGVEHTEAGTQRVNAAPLDRLWRAGTIEQREFEAGDDWRSIAYLAAVDASAMTVDWSRAGGGGRSSRIPPVLTVEAMASASITRRRYEQHFRLGTIVRDVLDRALVHEQSLEEIGRRVFGLANRRDATTAGLGALRASLGALADWQGR